MNLIKYLYILITIIFFTKAEAQTTIKGTVYEPDSNAVMPFVYVINLQSGQGQVSDGSGHFSVAVNNTDSLLFSFIGYIKLKIPVSKFTNPSNVKVYMREASIKLNQVTVNGFKLKPYEKDYMKRIINGSKTTAINAMQSPISALYMQFSKKGKEQRKLATIFENIFIEEQVAKKFNAEILRNLTGDDKVDFEKFRKYCYYLSNDYILEHDGYDLYYRVMDCYYRWKEEKR